MVDLEKVMYDIGKQPVAQRSGSDDTNIGCEGDYFEGSVSSDLAPT